ncbi:MAG: hypothetical protein IPP19_04930 [Verrucomicrobia bacterium]|nr:hypothetical protein [Verrucomicrobiota bacterium]
MIPNSILRLLGLAIVLNAFTAQAAMSNSMQYRFLALHPLLQFVCRSVFRPAATSAEVSARQALISAIQANPLGKTVVYHVFSTNWNRPFTLRFLQVGTIPSAERAQGKFTNDYWNKAREMFAQQARISAVTLRQQMVSYGLADPGDSMSRTIAAADNNTVILFGFAPTGKASDGTPLLMARKLRYFRKSIVLFEAGVDASAPRAMETLDYIIRTVDVQ